MAKKPTGAEQPFYTIVDSHPPGEPPKPLTLNRPVPNPGCSQRLGFMFLRALMASQRNHRVFDADQIRRFAKMLSGQVGRGSFVALRPATSQDLCQDGMQGLEELRSNGRRLNGTRRRDPHTGAGGLGLRSPVRDYHQI